MADDSAWADAFAAMSGEQEISFPESRVLNKHSTRDKKKLLTTASTTGTHKRKKLKHNDATCEAFLRSRTDFSNASGKKQLPARWKLGALTFKPQGSSVLTCSKYEPDGPIQDDSLSCSFCRCGNSPLCHSLDLEDDQSDTYGSRSVEYNVMLQLFSLQRNARALVSWISTGMNGRDKCTKSFATLEHCVAQSVNILIQNCHREFERSSYRNSSSLQEKIQQMILTARRWEDAAFRQVRERSKSANGTLHFFEARIRVLVAIDDFYYRLYYEQLVMIVTRRWNTVHRIAAFIPHPHVYFAIPGAAWSCSNVLAQQKEDTANGKGDEWLLLDPLASLHKHRLFETTLLFRSSGWCTSPESIRGHWNALDKYTSQDNFIDADARHETPAHPALALWRDSCRDFAAHLYCYATLPKGSYSRIIDSVQRVMMSSSQNKTVDAQQRPLVSFVEVGAGTGYLAYFLRCAGAQIIAFDSAPLFSCENIHDGSTINSKQNAHVNRAIANEYHGNTPAFLNCIQRGTQLALKSFQFTESVNSEAPLYSQGLRRLNHAALILCYPPSMDVMGEQSISNFLNAGGQCIVHIGEFSGLTGSPKLEQMLSSKLICVDRWECLHWGTDAASVTIWKVKERSKEMEPLVLCSRCLAKRAVKRCTFARDIAYCGSECFHADNDRRDKIMLDQYMLCLLDKTANIGKKLDWSYHFMEFSK